METLYLVAARFLTRERVDCAGLTCGFGCFGILWVLCFWWLQCRWDKELCIGVENGNIDIVVFGLMLKISKFRDGLYVLVEDGDADVFVDFFICYRSLIKGIENSGNEYWKDGGWCFSDLHMEEWETGLFYFVICVYVGEIYWYISLL